jgi:adenylate cyclase
LAFFRRVLRGSSHRQARVRQGTFLLTALGAALLALFAFASPLPGLHNSVSDLLFGASDAPEGVLIAEVDDRTLALPGLIQAPRLLHAQAITNLHEAGARIIVMDLLFLDPDPDNEALAEAIRAAGNVVFAVVGAQPLPSQEWGYNRFQTILAPPEPLRSAAPYFGHVYFPPDPDGVLRRLPLVIYGPDGTPFASIALATLLAESRQSLPAIEVESGDPCHGSSSGLVSLLGLTSAFRAIENVKCVNVLNQRIPVSNAAAMRPDFTARLDNFDRISYADVISGNFNRQLVAGKTVFVGLTSPAGGDRHLTPLSNEQEPGVVAIANAYQSIRDGIYVREASKGLIVLSVLPLFAVTVYILPRWNLQLAGAILVGLLAITWFFYIGLFNTDQKLLMNFVYPGILVPALYLVGLGHRITAERADRRQIADLFGRYASPEIVRELASAADRGQIELGGSIREVTVLFADLRGFTGVSERLPPTEVVSFLNQAFDIMIRSITRNDGIVNKFGGDMVMAIWNAPYDSDDHALKACRAAAEALAEMEASHLEVQDDPSARFGFGINTGEVVAGNLGSAGRLEYSVIGDPVNVGSRLCGIAGGGEIYIGPRTLELAGDSIEVAFVGAQTLKGRSRPVDAFKVLRVGDVAVESAVVHA